MSSALRFFLLLVSAWILSGPLADARTWTSTDGRTFEGELLGVEGNNAIIKRTADNQDFRVKISGLSEEDQAYVRKAQDGLQELQKFQTYAEKTQTRPAFMLKVLGIRIGTILLTLVIVYHIGSLFKLNRWSPLWSIWCQFLYVLTQALAFIGLLYAYYGHRGLTFAEGAKKMAVDPDVQQYATIIGPVFVIVFILIMAVPSSWMLRSTYKKAVGFLVAAQVAASAIAISSNWVIMWMAQQS